MFSTIENYYCWRFHAMAWCRALNLMIRFSFVQQWIMSIFEVLNMLLCFSFSFENTVNIPLIAGKSGVHSMCFRGDFTIKTRDAFMHTSLLERGGIRWRIFIHMQYFSYWLVLLYLQQLCRHVTTKAAAIWGHWYQHAFSHNNTKGCSLMRNDKHKNKLYHRYRKINSVKSEILYKTKLAQMLKTAEKER